MAECILIILEIINGLKKLSIVEDNTPNTVTPNAETVFPPKNKNRAIGTHTKIVPMIGMMKI